MNYFAIRSILETPICDRHKWAKVPNLTADAYIVDMEDSAPPHLKVEARNRAVEFLGRPDYFNGRPIFARCNSLDTEWGRDDLVALAKSKARIVAYPKTESPSDISQIGAIFREHGARVPDIFPTIETAQGMLNAEQIASCEGVKGLWFGPADLALDSGFAWFLGDDLNRDAFHYPRMRLVLIAAAHRLPIFEGAILPDFKDMDRMRQRATHVKSLGITGMVCFYPPQLKVINDVFDITVDALERATEIVISYERALNEGRASVQLHGRALIVQDYKWAMEVLARAKLRADM